MGKESSIRLLQGRSSFSKVIHPWLRKAFFPIVGKDDPQAFEEQFPLASRNVEIMVEYLLKMLKYPVKSSLVGLCISDWFTNYFGAQKKTADDLHYLVYTKSDHEVPFKPEEDIMYTYMVSQLAYIGNELVKTCSLKNMKIVTDCFRRANRLGTEVFYRYPTVMPRFTIHDRISLKVIQDVDKPLNCCPSLHITYSLLLDNIGEKVVYLPEKNEDAWRSVRTATEEMVNSVLYTKQHSLVDVAFGMLTAKMVFEQIFPDLKFNDFMDVYSEMQESNPDVSYDKIKLIYSQANDIQQMLKRSKSQDDLSSIVGIYFKDKKFPLVNPGENNAYFDQEKGLVIPF
ncbi:MAG: hypothetical protein ABH824_05280 [Nanoarchaeota archaeon]